MINGVLEIVAAVLFAVVYLSTGMQTVWACVAGFYLVCGLTNLAIHAIQNRRKLKKAEKTAKQAEQAAKTPVKTAEVVPEAEEAPVQELPEV